MPECRGSDVDENATSAVLPKLSLPLDHIRLPAAISRRRWGQALSDQECAAVLATFLADHAVQLAQRGGVQRIGYWTRFNRY
jgi:hypothetical protein